METLFIEAKGKINLSNSKIDEISNKLPKNIAIAYSIQYKGLAEQIKKILSKNHKIAYFVQVLGCSKPRFSKNQKPQAILLISSGRFHAINLSLQTKLPIYILEDGRLERISEQEAEQLENKQKAGYLKFLNAETVGILVSVKPGQENLKKAIELKKKLENKTKKSYLFMSNNINSTEFENFQIDSWVNTACPRLDMDSNTIISIDKIIK